jgi:hypothetical protein
MVGSAMPLAAGTCPLTKAPEPPFVPPPPYPQARGRSFHLGTPKLWVTVYPGPWQNLPLWPEGYRQKIVWWSEGYNARADPKPAISISGRRLDGSAPPLVVTGANGSWTNIDFIMSGSTFRRRAVGRSKAHSKGPK